MYPQNQQQQHHQQQHHSELDFQVFIQLCNFFCCKLKLQQGFFHSRKFIQSIKFTKSLLNTLIIVISSMNLVLLIDYRIIGSKIQQIFCEKHNLGRMQTYP